MTTFLLSGHVGALRLSEGASATIQQIAEALAGAGMHAVPLDDLEAAAIVNALSACNGNRTHAAAVLGISVRTLQRKLKESPERYDQLDADQPTTPDETGAAYPALAVAEIN